MSETDMTEYAELRAALYCKVTPGPWRLGGFNGVYAAEDEQVANTVLSRDARFIAAANPDTISALLKERDELLVALRDARRENERLRKDAARYRWLRRCRDLGDHTGVWEQLCGTGFRMRLDTFIDAILAADKAKEPPDE